MNDRVPGLVSIGITVYNGETDLREALESLLAQDYENIEVVILDNRSTDGTAEICREFAALDRRVRYVVDERRSDVVEGQKKVAAMARGEYFMIACDDDVYRPSYVRRMVELLEADPGVGMAYSGLGFVYPDGSVRDVNLAPKYFRSRRQSALANFAFYLLYRTPIPLMFGLVRADVHHEALLSYEMVDNRGSDHDNLYMLKLLSIARLSSTPEVLFFYRQRDRATRAPFVIPDGALMRYASRTLHQLHVSRAVAHIVAAAGFSRAQKLAMHLHNVAAFTYHVTLAHALATRWYRRLRGESYT
ncbi:MAG: glycosyltransferase family 2 protein [Gemmatimonadaceae bacterium]|nr:glycosyltransferase family 2 protein [Gemmatimonadaceae bacterium]